MNLFLSQMIRSPIKEHIVNAILNQLEIEREGYVINRSAVKSCVDVLLALHYETDTGPISVYKRDIEPAVLKESEAFYKEEGERLLMTCDSPEYLRRVSRCMRLIFLCINDHAGRRTIRSGRSSRYSLSLFPNGSTFAQNT